MHEDEILTGIALTEYIILQGQMTAMMQHAKSHNLGQACLEPQFICTNKPAQNHFMRSVSNEICSTNTCEICEVRRNHICICGPELHLK